MKELNVLIVEPHNYHFEVLPGVSYYFMRLGFSITLLVRESFNFDDTFAIFSDRELIRVIHYDIDSIREYLLSDEVKSYDICFFNSMEYFHGGMQERVLDYIGKEPQCRYGIMGIYHNADMISDADLHLIKENRIFALTAYDYKGHSIAMLSASHFGVMAAESVKDGIVILLIGNSNDLDLLQVAVGRHLRKLRERGVHIEHIGGLRFSLRELLKITYHGLKNKSRLSDVIFSMVGYVFISHLGKMKFRDLYHHVNSSDYLMFVSDMDNSDNPFLHGKTTGTKQLSLGFKKPCVLHSKLEHSFGFPKGCCVTYGDKVDDALLTICSSDNLNYAKMVSAVTSFSSLTVSQSMDNLEFSLRKIMEQEGK